MRCNVFTFLTSRQVGKFWLRLLRGNALLGYPCDPQVPLRPIIRGSVQLQRNINIGAPVQGSPGHDPYRGIRDSVEINRLAKDVRVSAKVGVPKPVRKNRNMGTSEAVLFLGETSTCRSR